MCLQGLTLKEVPNPAVSKAGKVRPYWNFSETGSDLIGTLAPLLLTNLLYSQNPLATLSWSLHLILYLLFFVSLRSDLVGYKPNQKPTRSDLVGEIIIFPLTLSLLFQTTLAAAQVYLGHSVGGLMYYLGERMAVVGSPGIALGSFMEQIVLRAYGTYSHPNILAGYAVIALLIILRLVGLQQPKPVKNARSVGLTLKEDPSPQTQRREGQTQLVLLTTFLTTLLVILTQSRAAAISLFGIIIPFYLIKNIKHIIIYFVVILSIICYLSSLLLPTRSDLSSSQRLTLQDLSWSVIKTYPVFGTGAQSSISTYPSVDSSVRLLQPDHNSFTLFLSWFGVFGLIAILYSLRPTTYNLRSLLPILPPLLFDHYLLTSPQGMFVLVLYLGLVGLQLPGLKSTSRQRV